MLKISPNNNGNFDKLTTTNDSQVNAAKNTLNEVDSALKKQSFIPSKELMEGLNAIMNAAISGGGPEELCPSSRAQVSAPLY